MEPSLYTVWVCILPVSDIGARSYVAKLMVIETCDTNWNSVWVAPNQDEGPGALKPGLLPLERFLAPLSSLLFVLLMILFLGVVPLR